MKVIVALCLLVSIALAAPPPVYRGTDSQNADILRFENDNTGTGSYNYAYEQTDGTKQEQEGKLVNVGLEDEHLVVKGRFTFIGDDGVTYVVTYIADENGYQPEIEQGPGGAVPDAVVASLLVLMFLLGAIYSVYSVPAPSFLDSVSDCYDYKEKFWSFDNFKSDYSGNKVAYKFGFEQLDGTRQEQEGEFINKGGEDFLSVNGFYSYIGNDGVSEDVELRRIFPNEFPMDTIRRSGSPFAEHLGRYTELKSYFHHPKSKLNSHFEEMICYNRSNKKICKIDVDRYLPEENSYYSSVTAESHVDRRRVYCFMLLCFTEDELDRVFFVLSLLTVAAAAPQAASRSAPNEDVQILRFDSSNDGLGSYNFAFEQSDGTKKEEQGELRNAGTDDEFMAVKGSYSWQGPDGVVYTITYTADDNGFKPTIEQGPGGGVPPGVVASLLG
ncbi:Endocuticle structural glycoprotein ABD-5 [Papilio machaon]|uniref:Endocuticle structural glycoprotein ABD-5 n=1 Tax=Papilio machaon TaxID=76193 RepID=A0A194R0P2_PAPMA|nr:Endocuticle structural glycoprotein ABD-5 [Papilio machaon]